MQEMAHSMHHFAFRTFSILVKLWLWKLVECVDLRKPKRGRGARLFSRYYWFNNKKKTITIRKFLFLHLQLLLDLCPSSLWFVCIIYSKIVMCLSSETCANWNVSLRMLAGQFLFRGQTNLRVVRYKCLHRIQQLSTYYSIF